MSVDPTLAVTRYERIDPPSADALDAMRAEAVRWARTQPDTPVALMEVCSALGLVVPDETV